MIWVAAVVYVLVGFVISVIWTNRLESYSAGLDSVAVLLFWPVVAFMYCLVLMNENIQNVARKLK